MIAILGGTFDPIHKGHLALADQTDVLLNPQQIRFMPCKQPVHKENSAVDTNHRIAMLNLAIEHKPNYVIDKREIERESKSYALESLQSLRFEFPNAPLFFIIGMDSLNSLHRWFKWRECLQNAHFLVFQRPGETANPDSDVQTFIAGDICEFHQSPSNSGKIYLAEHTQVAISSSQLRSNLTQYQQEFLPNKVCDYIKQHRLYQ